MTPRVRTPSGAGAAAVAALLAVAVTVSACGVPTSGSPRGLSPSLLPKVLSQPLPTLPPVHLPDPQLVQVPIFLVNPQQRLTVLLQYVRRPATPQNVLDRLVAGPSGTNVTEGYQTAIPLGSHLSVRGIPKGVAVVELDRLFFDLVGEAPLLECGQIVLTLTTAFPHIKAVRFYYGGSPTAAEIGTGRYVFRAVTAGDYKDLRH